MSPNKKQNFTIKKVSNTGLKSSLRAIEQYAYCLGAMPMRQPFQKAGQCLRKKRFQDAEFEQGEEEVVSQSHQNDVDTTAEVVALFGFYLVYGWCVSGKI